ITAVKALVRGAWEKTSRVAKGSEITAADLKAAVTLDAAELPEKQKADLAAFADGKGMKAYKNYRTTSDHWRVILSVVQDEIVAGATTPLKPLAQDAPAELADVTTRVSLLLLQRAGQIAVAERTPYIEGPQVKKAHAELSQKYGLTNTPRSGAPLAAA